MKKFLFLALISLLSFNVFAGRDTVKSKNFYCKDLKKMVEDKGRVAFKNCWLCSYTEAYSEKYIRQNQDFCTDFNQDTYKAIVRAKDTRRCYVGTKCITEFPDRRDNPPRIPRRDLIIK